MLVHSLLLLLVYVALARCHNEITTLLANGGDCLLECGGGGVSNVTTTLPCCHMVVYLIDRIQVRDDAPHAATHRRNSTVKPSMLGHSHFMCPSVVRCNMTSRVCRADKPWVSDLTVRCERGASRASQCVVEYSSRYSVSEILLCALFVASVIAVGALAEILQWYYDDYDDDGTSFEQASSCATTMRRRGFVHFLRKLLPQVEERAITKLS